MSSAYKLHVIKIPTTIKKQMEIAIKLKKKNQYLGRLQKERQGNQSIPIISSKHSDKNFYKNQTYSKFSPVPLASKGWIHKKSKGDFFSIKKFAENSAFQDEVSSFEELNLDQRIVDQLNELGMTKPTNIQRLAIPHILEGSNTIIAAETGCGKTCAYLAPIIHKILEMKKIDDELGSHLNSPKAIIIVPARELVVQVKDMARALGSPLGLNINSLIGGRTKRMMLNPLVRETDLLISSFGALSKLTTMGILKRDCVKHIILDEADTLMDDSFNSKIIHYLSKFPIRVNLSEDVERTASGIQLILAGATFPTSTKNILEPICDIDSVVKIKTDFLHRVPGHIDQKFLRLADTDRVEKLLGLCKKLNKSSTPTIIFCNTNRSCDFVSLFLNENGIRCTHFNGDMRFQDRIGKFQAFQENKVSFLCCTDLGSRGLDTTRAEHIINFDFPKFMSDYIHRCGRTGRVGGSSRCTVTNFISKPGAVDLVQKVEYAIRKREELPNVNANIKRIKRFRIERDEQAKERELLETATETTQ